MEVIFKNGERSSILTPDKIVSILISYGDSSSFFFLSICKNTKWFHSSILVFSNSYAGFNYTQGKEKYNWKQNCCVLGCLLGTRVKGHFIVWNGSFKHFHGLMRISYLNPLKQHISDVSLTNRFIIILPWLSTASLRGSSWQLICSYCLFEL